jgi:formylmethanofuran dehydrogenase subunit E
MPNTVEYHPPKDFGTCDGCGHPFKRATHRMPDGDDLCGRCYGVAKGYIDAPEGRR